MEFTRVLRRLGTQGRGREEARYQEGEGRQAKGTEKTSFGKGVF
jgi:hypothetical protein